MGAFEEKVKKMCADRELPGVILLARDNGADFPSGHFQYTETFGHMTPTEPMHLDATFWLASCTKLLTTIAILQCVESGQIKLDDDVSSVLTELKDIEILTGFQDGTDTPILKKAENKITLRHLLTHSAGFGYDHDGRYQRWSASRIALGQEEDKSMMGTISKPLLFEPGTSWEYGYSLEWVGVLVTRLSAMSLEEYMQKHIWHPLGIQNITFHSGKKPFVKENLVKMSRRVGNPTFGLPIRNEEKVEWLDESFSNTTPDEYGGGGLTGSATDFMKILQSIGSNDGKLLGPAAIDEMFTPQLTGTAAKTYQDDIGLPFMQEQFASHKAGTKVNWGLGGMMVLEDEDTGRTSGTLSWSGMPNLLWSIDRNAGLNLLYASNILPCGDFKSGDVQRWFEKKMYMRFQESGWFAQEWKGT
ncbi:Acyltransferase [Lachnellula subtilissima]|uniref:Acyltransferase n=1 Tax=Lachnellula subtilissima TaxID=602034 RepID=A0A8H8RHR5_9HELO|nr:Acyltransferase [Lachnellula subtilissima]